MATDDVVSSLADCVVSYAVTLVMLLPMKELVYEARDSS